MKVNKFVFSSQVGYSFTIIVPDFYTHYFISIDVFSPFHFACDGILLGMRLCSSGLQSQNHLCGGSEKTSHTVLP